MMMARSTDLHIRIDLETKTSAEKLFRVFGMTVTDAVTMFLRQSILVGGLPFEVKQPHFNAETEAAIRETRDISNGLVDTKHFSSFGEFMADLEQEEC
jgi:DNA-damage-inducible protein J